MIAAVDMCAKFHQAKCSSSRIIVVTEKLTKKQEKP